MSRIASHRATALNQSLLCGGFHNPEGNGTDTDNVRLDATIMPQLSSLALVSLGGVALAGAGRRRR